MKNIFKRVVASLLVAVMLFGSAPIESLTGIDFDSPLAVEAEATSGAMEICMFPFKKQINMSRSNYYAGDPDQASTKKSSNHRSGYAYDFCNKKDGKYEDVYAPFTGKIVISKEADLVGGNGVYLQSVEPVLLANGEISYLTAMFLHDNDISKLKELAMEGKTIKQGEPFYNQGNAGNTKDVHLHFEIAKGTISKYSDMRTYGVQAYDACYLPDDITESKSWINVNGKKYKDLPWKYVSEAVNADVDLKTESYYYYLTASSEIKTIPQDDMKGTAFAKGSKVIVLGNCKDKPWKYVESIDGNIKGFIKKSDIAKSKETIPAATLTRAYEDGSGTVRNLNGRLHKKGESFRILGNLKSYTSNMNKVTAITVKYNASTDSYDIPICESSVSINTKNYTLTKSSGANDKKSINTNLIFKGLDVGHYRFMMIVEDDSKCTLVDDAYFEVSDKIEKSQDGKASKPAKVKAPSAWSQIGEWVTSKVSSITSIVSSILSYKNELIDVSNMIAYADIPDDPNSGVGSGGTGSGGTGSSNSGNSSSSSSSASAPVSNGYKLGVYRTTSADRLNIRKGPGTSYGFATTAIPKSSEIAIYEVSSNGWGKTKYNGVEGWVSMNLCTYVRELETVQKPEAPTVKLSTAADVPTGAIISASWLGVSDADSYTAYLKNSNGAVIATQDGIKGYSVSFTVANAGVYTITVSAVNSKYSTESAPSAAFTVHAPLTVSFVDWDGRTETRTVPYGGAATAPNAPTREGYNFTGWDKTFNKITENIAVNATYEIKKYTVKFVDNKNTVISTQKVEHGSAATPPGSVPTPDYYVFVGWSNEDYKSVKKDLTVEAVYRWENANLPIGVSVKKAVRWDEGYNITLDLTNSNKSQTTGRAIVALKTSEGKLVELTESAAFSVPSGTAGQVTKTMEIFVPSEKPAVKVEVIIVDSYSQGVPLSKIAKSAVDMGLQWSAWSTTKPDENTYDGELQSRTEYSYRNKETKTANTKTLSGWTYDYTKTDQRSKVSTYSYVAPVNTESHVRTVATKEEPINETWYRYTHYTNGGYNSKTKKTTKWACGPDGTTVDPTYGPLTIGPHTHETKTKLSSQSSDYGTKYGPYDCKEMVSSKAYANKTECLNTWFYNETAFQKQVGTKLKYTYQDTYYTYYFYRWTDWSAWSATKSTGTEVKTRTTYRYRNKALDVPEDTSGSFMTVSTTVDPAFAGKQAAIFVHKYDEVSDWTCEYVCQIAVGANGVINFNFKPREVISAATGDFTVSVGIEGCTDIIEIAKFEAPKAKHTVKFFVNNELVSEQSVQQGSSVTPPANPVKEGFVFTGWQLDLSCITEELNLHAGFEPVKYTVVFVDWTNQVVQTAQYDYGSVLVPPELTVPEGYKHTGWENVTLGETVVTGDMVIAAEFEKLTYEVSFYDFDNNLISTQTVEYGEAPNFVDVPEKNNHIFTEWVSDDNTMDNTSGQITLYPSFIFAETVAEPVASVASGTYNEAQTVELTCETEDAVIYYTLDGTDPTEGGMEYTGPITVDRSTELKFCAYAFEKNDSEVVTNYYAINTGNTVSGWMLQEDIPDYVTNDADTYKLEYEVGYRFKDIVATSSYSNILALENGGWTNNGFEYGEWSDWLIYEPNLEDMAYEVESQQPAPEEELRYLYTRFKYADAETGEYVYTYQEVEGVDGEWEEYLTSVKLSVAGYVSGTQVKYYEVDGEKWYNQSLTTVEVVPDYLMYRYRTKEYTLTKWTGWTTDAPAEGEMRETEKDTVYRYFIPEMYVVNIVPDYSKFGMETITFIVEANELIEIDEADYQYLGHDFVGFYTDTEFTKYWNHKTETVTSSLTLYPQYKAHSFDVIFVDYDGTVLSEETVDYGESALAPDVGERDGYVFIGWDTDNLDYVTETMIVTAQYVTEDEYCKVSLSHSKYNLMVGTSFTLVATITPENAENKNLNWYTDDTNVAVVNDEGVVTGVSEGVAIVTVEAEATGEMVECIVNVSKNPSESLCLISGSKLGLDEENGLLRGVSNTDCTVESIKAEFMNTDLVFTDKDGNILEDTALAGTGTVISFSNGGKVVDEITVVVTGDMTGDGLVNNRDAAMITRYLVEKETADFAQMVAIDVNGDGYINNRDASMVSRYLVGKETI